VRNPSVAKVELGYGGKGGEFGGGKLRRRRKKGGGVKTKRGIAQKKGDLYSRRYGRGELSKRSFVK